MKKLKCHSCSLPSNLGRPSWESLPPLNFPSASVMSWGDSNLLRKGYSDRVATTTKKQKKNQVRHEYLTWFMWSPAVLFCLQQGHQSYPGLQLLNLEASAMHKHRTRHYKLHPGRETFSRTDWQSHNELSYLLCLFHLKSLQYPNTITPKPMPNMAYPVDQNSLVTVDLTEWWRPQLWASCGLSSKEIWAAEVCFFPSVMSKGIKERQVETLRALRRFLTQLLYICCCI